MTTPTTPRTTTTATRLALSVAAALTAAALTGCGADPDAAGTKVVGEDVAGSGACPAPEVELSVTEVAPGATVEVTVDDLVDGCRDTGGAAFPLPIQNAGITFSQGGRSAAMGAADAEGAQGRVATSVRIPEWAVAGPATVTVEFAESVTVVVTG